MASNQVVTYEEVKAYQANNGISTYEVGSGGYTTGGIYVEWTTDGGFTNSGWDDHFDNPDSPVYGMLVEDINKEIERVGNLDEVFKTWVNTQHYETRYNWILTNVDGSCRNERL